MPVCHLLLERRPNHQTTVLLVIMYSALCLLSFGNFTSLAHGNKKHLLETKESLLIIRDEPSLNRNINLLNSPKKF